MTIETVVLAIMALGSSLLAMLCLSEHFRVLGYAEEAPAVLPIGIGSAIMAGYFTLEILTR